MRMKLVEPDRLPFEARGQFTGALISAVRDKDGPRATRHQMTRGKFGHLPGANQADLLSLERAEDFRRQINRGRCYGY